MARLDAQHESGPSDNHSTVAAARARPAGSGGYRQLARALPMLAAGLLLTACSSGSEPQYNPAGAATPTVAGGPAPTYDGYQSARDSFTRQSEDGSITAVLEDSAWLKYEGSAEEVMADHRAYFEFGYTTFNVRLLSIQFTRPTEEVFVLEDSTGARLTGKPRTFSSPMALTDKSYMYEFALSFQHVISKDVKWIRLTRLVTGASVEWSFGGPGGSVPVTRER